ncbi:MAG: dephospho-CoA kinase [Ruminococcus sp.]|nr:dephospho-CoA kinase [Ruminococcus sp.]MBQ1815007.1 dephospho-CoA kinase [Ruminococcus sp.]
MKRTRIIGLTGQSGAGKSTVGEIFAQNGIKVISADSLVAEIYRGGSPCLKTIAACFGSDIIDQNGEPNRRLLAQRAFSSKENTVLLGKIVHPFVTAELFRELKDNQYDVIIYDAPQLFEADAQVICDAVVSVVADEKIRLKRILSRDNISEEQVRQRFSAQLDEAFFRKNSDFVIENNGDKNNLRQQAQKVAEAVGKG